MAKRDTLKKRIRFEVFKRDKFTCQYCGAKSPEVVLNVDHIDPVANGGDNDIINLITSCFDCNSGKSDKLLQDSSAIEKQRKQLELLQERREQIELMFEWKKSLSEFDQDVNGMIADYINSKISPQELTHIGRASIKAWVKKFELQYILDGIDLSAGKYLLYDSNGATDDSIRLFLEKIGGVLHVKGLPQIQQKIAYIKGIARNRFDYWDDRKGAIILSNYLKALEQHYNEEQILRDLETEVEPLTKSSANWSEWKNTLENWIIAINKWDKSSETDLDTRLRKRDFTPEQLEKVVTEYYHMVEDHIFSVEHIGSILPDFDRTKFRKELLKELLNFLTDQREDNLEKVQDYHEAKAYLEGYILQTDLTWIFESYSSRYSQKGFAPLEEKAHELLIEILLLIYTPSMFIKDIYLEQVIDLYSNMLLQSLS